MSAPRTYRPWQNDPRKIIHWRPSEEVRWASRGTAEAALAIGGGDSPMATASCLWARDRAGRLERFRRIEEAGVPQRRIRQRAGSPLLDGSRGGGNHTTIGGVENHDNARQCRRSLAHFLITFFQQEFRVLEPRLCPGVFRIVVDFFDGKNFYILTPKRPPVSWERRSFFPGDVKQICGGRQGGSG